MKKLPHKYRQLWLKCLPLLKGARKGDINHTSEMVDFLLNNERQFNFDLDILIPLAMLHDIHHSAILEEHFKNVRLEERMPNGQTMKLSASAKVAEDLLNEVGYGKDKILEILDIITTHDKSRVDDAEAGMLYNTQNKKAFHDVDIIARCNKTRIKKLKKICQDRRELIKVMQSQIKLIFNDKLRHIAEQRFKDAANIIEVEW